MFFFLNPLAATIFALVLFLGGLIYFQYYYVDFAEIKGIPEIPGGSFVYGHLDLLGHDHPTVLQQWADENSWPLYQVRLGNRRAVVLNTFQVARDWLVTNQASTLDRPWLYTFHGVVSKTSASAIGTNPWNETTKKQRRVVASLTNAPAIKRLEPLLDLETTEMLLGLHQAGSQGQEVMPHVFQKRLALNIVMMFCYGKRFVNIDDSMLIQILSDASVISSFRSTNSNSQDYVPYLRIFKNQERMSVATEVRSRRDAWLAKLLQKVEEEIREGNVSNCMAANLLTNTEDKLSKQDVKTIIGGLVSGGFETTFASAIAGIGLLASPEGQSIQKRAYDDIMSVYAKPEEAYRQSVCEEKSEYVAAFVKEVLRHYPPLHLMVPRQVYRDFEYRGAHIPKGVMILTNAQAINHDPVIFGLDAYEFNPDRWLSHDPETTIPSPFHFSFGAGGRSCTAINFLNRILYSIFFRLILSYKITGSKEMPPVTHHIDYNKDTTAQSAIPKDFKAVFAVRDQAAFDRSPIWFRASIYLQIMNQAPKSSALSFGCKSPIASELACPLQNTLDKMIGGHQRDLAFMVEIMAHIVVLAIFLWRQTTFQPSI
ncbi:Phenylacetate 2-hydroxylase [Venturia nashicola]|uniref:Phenylacetate 2-hydroxylase n=1 Tax=Venturia nashicola TaxID=86259 RepID=A0A4Z1PJY8_9PEZI|nr:Phenylacetate 2-hydroxylase [Venturia nashicola]